MTAVALRENVPHCRMRNSYYSIRPIRNLESTLVYFYNTQLWLQTSGLCQDGGLARILQRILRVIIRSFLLVMGFFRLSELFAGGLIRLWNPWTDEKYSFEAVFDKGVGLSFFSTWVFSQELSAWTRRLLTHWRSLQTERYGFSSLWISCWNERVYTECINGGLMIILLYEC